MKFDDLLLVGISSTAGRTASGRCRMRCRLGGRSINRIIDVSHNGRIECEVCCNCIIARKAVGVKSAAFSINESISLSYYPT